MYILIGAIKRYYQNIRRKFLLEKGEEEKRRDQAKRIKYRSRRQRVNDKNFVCH